MKCEVESVWCEVESVKCGVWNGKCESTCFGIKRVSILGSWAAAVFRENILWCFGGCPV